MGKLRDYFILVGLAGLVLAADQWTKALVRTQLALGEAWMPLPWLAPYARIVHWSNTGAAFGLFPAGGMFFTIIAVVVAVAILIYYPRIPRGQVLLRLALALQLGGAMGNLTDRLIQGTVTDFISVGRFPVFNLADSSIFVGAVILVVTMWLEERREAREKASAAPSEEESRTEQSVG